MKPRRSQQTLARIRQRYALFFNLPDGVEPGRKRNIEVVLTPAALQRYPDAQVKYRRVYMTPAGGAAPSPREATNPDTTPVAPSAPDGL